MNRIQDYKNTAQLKKLGLTKYVIQQLVKNGELVRLKQGFYRPAVLFLQNQSFIDVCNAMPKGVICLLSALSFYDLTTHIPKQIDVALSRMSVRTKIRYPPIKRYYIADKKFDKYIKIVKNSQYSFRIYDIEKCVSDAVKYRNRIGIDIAKEVLKEYLKRKDKNIAKLLEIAKLQKSEKILKEWLMVLF
jgi:predicted transcriptional regulator of viral defense system